jgi:arylsulfatase A-like enzyme
MFRGLLPDVNGAHVNGEIPTPLRRPLLAETLRAAGLRNAAFTASRVHSRQSGFARGFETFDEPRPRRGVADPGELELPAEHRVSRALAWLAANGDAPFFLWVHLFEPHAPHVDPRTRQEGPRAYAAEISVADAAVGSLLAAV